MWMLSPSSNRQLLHPTAIASVCQRGHLTQMTAKERLWNSLDGCDHTGLATRASEGEQRFFEAQPWRRRNSHTRYGRPRVVEDLGAQRANSDCAASDVACGSNTLLMSTILPATEPVARWRRRQLHDYRNRNAEPFRGRPPALGTQHRRLKYHWQEVGSLDSGLHSSKDLETQNNKSGVPFVLQIFNSYRRVEQPAKARSL